MEEVQSNLAKIQVRFYHISSQLQDHASVGDYLSSKDKKRLRACDISAMVVASKRILFTRRISQTHTIKATFVVFSQSLFANVQ